MPALASNSKKIKTAFERLLAKYEASQTPFYIATRPYYSSGAIPFFVVDQNLVGATQRAFAVATAGTTFDLFSYGKGSPIEDVGLSTAQAPRTARDFDTNQATGSRTNGEDFAVEGISATNRGIRAQYPSAVVDALALVVNPFIRNALKGGTTIQDPNSSVVAPEVGSPLILEDVAWEAIKPKMVIRTSWNRKAEDLIGTADEFPEGGARSYLHASGEPSHHNFTRIPEGYIWQKDGSAQDTLFGLNIQLQGDVVIPITRAEGYQVVGSALGFPAFLWSEFKLRLHGRAFYEASKN
jgi:hypothetical protein